MKKLSSHQIRQILVCVTQNRSYRELEDQLGVSKASISRIFNASVRGDKSPRKLLKLTDNELEEFFYPTSGSKFVEPDWPQIHSQLQRRGVTLQMLYEKFKAQTSRPVYTYTSFSRGYARWKADNGVRQSGINAVAGTIMHSDRGTQYCSAAFQNRLMQLDMRCSMSEVGQCWDNAPGESIWSSLKRETLIGRTRFDSYEQAVITVTRWIETYNTIRPHSTIGMLAPVNYEKQLLGVS